MSDGSAGGAGRRFAAIAAIAACEALVLAGCGGRAAVPSQPRTATSAATFATAPSTTALLSPAQTAERDALTAYHGMWEDWIAMAATGDYQNPRLARHASGEALSLIYRSVYANKRDGLVARGRPTFSGMVSAAKPADIPDRITVKDCSDGSDWLNYTLDGKLKDTDPGGRHFVQALVVKNSGVWKVDILVIQAVGTC
ncbi:hypothetical protein [Frankia sp. CiP3]|uniref:hypothetical protein n=1 Tax=Frankia sp. CiP3 TaxID=2880971 RepID=UPI001EF46E07|nr:hypothetical protein [Frankia sp. CiP3]